MCLVYPYQTGSHDGYNGLRIVYPSVILMTCTALSLNNNNNCYKRWATINILYNTTDLLVSCLTLTSRVCPFVADYMCISDHKQK
uniref:Uncharacterized protein n=1 Tax=Octopus bimaculoides TaxID=37653 RepID=A0A0L8IHV3_OCTBM